MEKENYTIDFHTGVTWEFTGTLEEAEAKADSGAAYTGQPITIHIKNGFEIARRPWWDTEYDPDIDEEEPDEIINFGKFGFYGAWEDVTDWTPTYFDPEALNNYYV